MTVNLHARDDFAKGDLGCATGHRVSRAVGTAAANGPNVVTALQDIKAGTNGWFDDQRPR